MRILEMKPHIRAFVNKLIAIICCINGDVCYQSVIFYLFIPVCWCEKVENHWSMQLYFGLIALSMGAKQKDELEGNEDHQKQTKYDIGYH